MAQVLLCRILPALAGGPAASRQEASPLEPPSSPLLATRRCASAASHLKLLRTRGRPLLVAAKLRAEDGHFRASGGFGLTKQNELVVSRVAMMGFAASLLGEALTGRGILAQLDLETGVPLAQAEPLLLLFVLLNMLGAAGALGDRGRFVDEAAREPRVSDPVCAALGLGRSSPFFGFTKANELFVGRVAQLGFAVSLLGEVLTGRGALAQLNMETGVPPWELEPLLLYAVTFFFVTAIDPGTGTFVNDDDMHEG